jgi:hypothetical protein
MEEVTVERNRGSGLLIMGDIEPFKSPVDGSVITGRSALRQHNKRHNVTNPADYKEEWKTKAKERAKVFTPGAGFDKQRRIEHIKRALERPSKGK